MGKRHTPKARQYRKRQLERLGYDEDKIADILDYEFDLLMGRYPNVPLEGQKYEDGGEVDPLKGLSNDDKRRILRIGTEMGVQNLTDDEYNAFNQMQSNRKRGIPNFAKPFKRGGCVTSYTSNSRRGAGAALRGTNFKGIF